MLPFTTKSFSTVIVEVLSVVVPNEIKAELNFKSVLLVALLLTTVVSSAFNIFCILTPLPSAVAS